MASSSLLESEMPWLGDPLRRHVNSENQLYEPRRSRCLRAPVNPTLVMVP